MPSFDKQVQAAGPRPGDSEPRTRQSLARIAERFAVDLKTAGRVTHAALSEVYVVQDPAGQRYVLRGQPATAENTARLARAAQLADRVRPLLDVELPRFYASGGQRYAVCDGQAWTLYPLIEGDVVCSWRDSDKASRADIETAAGALRLAHDRTQGVFHDDDRSFFVDDIKTKLAAIEGILSPAVRARVTEAIESVESAVAALDIGSLGFVHGDFHLGNVILDRGRVRGLIDVDWCRVGHPFEDLALFAMMTVRDYTRPSYEDDRGILEGIKKSYGFDDRDAGLFDDYFILSVLHDVYVFKYMIVDPNAPYLVYQVQMLERCRKS